MSAAMPSSIQVSLPLELRLVLLPGASGGLSGAAALRGARDLAGLTGAFGVTFWWVAALTLAAVIPAFLLPARTGGMSGRPRSRGHAVTRDRSAGHGPVDMEHRAVRVRTGLNQVEDERRG
jgi:hypothetical protein